MQPPRQAPRKRSARASLLALLAAGSLLIAIGRPTAPVTAFPMVTPGPGDATPAPPPATPPPGTLPVGSTLTFVLDGPISSASSKPGDLVNAHLKSPLIVGHSVVAPEGTPVQIRIVDAVPAQNPDIYGYVDIYFEPLHLPNGSAMPLRPPTSHLSVNPSAGHQSTVDVENTIGDIFLPGAIFHALRKGRNFVLEPGADVRAKTEAGLTLLPNGSVAVSTPAPLVLDEATPHATFNSSPLATPNPDFQPKMPDPRLDTSTPHP